jgi:murein L,D-transpeptidase YcbB/YkuD
LLDAIRSAHDDGLDPADYHLAAIEHLSAELSNAGGAPGDLQADLDMLQTDALLSLANHLYFGKVDPERLDPDWNLDKEFGDLEPVETLTHALEAGNIPGFLAEVRPQHPLYGQLKSALARYRAIAARGGWPSVPDGPKLEKGMRGERVGALRKRLAVTGDGPTATPAVPSQFDEPLEHAVRDFQRRQGLPVDGAVGANTLEALNVPVGARIDQIRVNLERARWVLHEVKGDFLVVDVAGFSAAYVRNGETVWRSRVQVGTPYRKTPTFKSAISYLVFNPTWTVPPTILKKDILPAMRQGGNEVEKRGLKVLDREGHPVDPGSVNWSHYKAGNFPYLLRQDGGPKNALGRVKFMFPNQHSVYLHDTPKKNLFDKPERAFSSGCIRIEHPIELAELLLDNATRWDREKILAAIDTKATRTVFLPRPVPVLLLYWTVFFDEAGHVGFKKDIYERDRAVLEGLGQESRFRARPAV